MDDGVVIVGTGHGGVQAAASLREEGYDGPVTLVGDETDLPYHKPPLSKTFIKDPAAKPQLLRGDTFYDTNRIALRLGSRAARIDLGGHALLLDDGSALPFSRLILATGSRPRALPVPGATLRGVLPLREIADARAIREHSTGAQSVVVVGGGFIGLEIAATLAAAGRAVTVLEAQGRLLGRAVAPIVSEHVRMRLEAAGVHVRLQTTLDRLEGDNGKVVAAVTGSGERLAAEMVIVGIGVVPNIELAEAAGITTANGIRVDAAMRSSVPEVLALGDVASYRHWFTEADVRLESVQNATDQARLAARTVVGHAGSYDAVPWFWSDIGDMKLQMVGLTGGSDRQIVSGDPAENRFAVHHYLGDRLIGVESVNRPADHMLGRKMLGAGFSPAPDIAVAGPEALKAALAVWQSAEPASR